MRTIFWDIRLRRFGETCRHLQSLISGTRNQNGCRCHAELFFDADVDDPPKRRLKAYMVFSEMQFLFTMALHAVWTVMLRLHYPV
jgi:hypothetical protein